MDIKQYALDIAANIEELEKHAGDGNEITLSPSTLGIERILYTMEAGGGLVNVMLVLDDNAPRCTVTIYGDGTAHIEVVNEPEYFHYYQPIYHFENAVFEYVDRELFNDGMKGVL